MKFSYIAGIIGLVTIVFVVFLVQTDSTPDQNEASVFLVTTFLSDVFVKSVEEENFSEVPVETGVETGEGATIKTSETGRAIVESTDYIVTVVDRNSEYIVETFQNGGKQISIRLISGNLWSRIGKTLEQDESYEVRTRNTIAAVRGTSFGTTYIDGITTYTVTNGEVIAFIIDLDTGEVIKKSKQTIRSGEKATVEKEGVELVVSKVTEADRESEWLIFNSQERNIAPVLNEAPPSVDFTSDVDVKDAPVDVSDEDTEEIIVDVVQPRIEARPETIESEQKIETKPEVIKSEPRITESTVVEPGIEVKMLVFREYYFPLSQFDKHFHDKCSYEHYHADQYSDVAYAIDSPTSVTVITTQFPDPSGCGYGVVKDAVIKIITISNEQMKAFSEHISL